MLGSFSAELLVLRKRASTWVLLGLWAVMGAAFGYALPYATYRNNVGALPIGLPSELLPSGLVANLVSSFPFYGGAMVLILGALAIGSEYGWGTWKTVFTQRPGRLHVFAAKLAALGVALVAFVVVAFAVGAAGSLVVAAREGAAIDWPSGGLLVRAVAASWFVLAVWTAFGILLAVLARGTALAIGIGILYGLVIEGLVSGFFNQVSLLRPVLDGFLRTNAYSLVAPLGTSVEATADNGPGRFLGPYVDATQALLVLAAYLAGFTLLSALLLRRRDVV